MPDVDPEPRDIPLIPGYRLRRGSGLDRALLVKFMQRTYRELDPQHSGDHLARTVEQYFLPELPLWWVEPEAAAADTATAPRLGGERQRPSPVGCLWLGNSIDQMTGKCHAHVFLLYVHPDHRRRGIGSALMQQAEAWAKARGDSQIGLHVFCRNQPAVNLYQKLGYQPQSVWMVKQL
ncbi:MAG: GNAT family N-acetyltransferase [Synechococcales cyanobacterium M58_A2018_015]|nr:GNAT family N-acetyltransferase [Synechococcales cyanobacterium M58_A2018_015]